MRNTNKTPKATICPNESKRHHLWEMLKRLGVNLNEYGNVINTILSNNEPTLLRHSNGEWVIGDKEDTSKYAISLEDKKITIRRLAPKTNAGIEKKKKNENEKAASINKPLKKLAKIRPPKIKGRTDSLLSLAYMSFVSQNDDIPQPPSAKILPEDTLIDLKAFMVQYKIPFRIVDSIISNNFQLCYIFKSKREWNVDFYDTIYTQNFKRLYDDDTICIRKVDGALYFSRRFLEWAYIMRRINYEPQITTHSSYRRPFVRIIYTPTGGQNKRK